VFLALGIGCKKGTSEETIAKAVSKFFEDNGIAMDSIDYVSSIDLKADEPGLVAFCRSMDRQLITYPAEDLKAVPGEFSASAFVEETTGVDNVCERSAVLASCGSLIVKKTVVDGVTLALAQKPYTPDWRWQG